MTARWALAGSSLILAALACASCSLAIDASDIDDQCPTNFKFCRGQCVEDTDPDFGCGPTCGDTCTLENAVATCDGADCVVEECAYGFAVAKGDTSRRGCPVNYLADALRCGVDQIPCPAGEFCLEGECKPRWSGQ